MIKGSYTLGCLSGTVRFPVTAILESDALCLYPQEKMDTLIPQGKADHNVLQAWRFTIGERRHVQKVCRAVRPRSWVTSTETSGGRKRVRTSSICIPDPELVWDICSKFQIFFSHKLGIFVLSLT